VGRNLVYPDTGPNWCGLYQPRPRRFFCIHLRDNEGPITDTDTTE